MDFELEQRVILCYELVGQAAVSQEETQEAIVPDACPDMLRIVDVAAQAFPARCEAREGQASVFGTVRAAVLYLPENGGLLQRMELTVPFTITADIPGLTADGVIQPAVRLRRADARMLNPRKVLLRCDLAGELTAFSKVEHPVTTGVGGGEGEHICQQHTQLEHETIVSVPQRIFPISEEIRLTGTQPPTLLSCRGEASCQESRLIGSKLILKGKLDVQLLLQSQDGTLEHRTESFPFSQIMETRGGGEGSTCDLRLEVCELTCVQPLDDPFCLSLDGEVLAMAQVRDRDTISVLTDLYSTTHQTQLAREGVTLFTPREQSVIPQTLRDLLETDDVVRGVCDSRFDLGQLLRSREGENMALTARGRIAVLYLDEERLPRQLDKEVEVTVRIPCPVGWELICTCTRPNELFAAPCAGGIEVRLGLEFQTSTARPLPLSVIGRAEEGEPRGTDCARPSVILRQPEAGESLWDIAKACGTTRERIMQANELTGEELPRQQMLLIPSAR